MRPHIIHIIGTPNAGGVQRLLLDLTQTENFSAFKHSAVCICSSAGTLVGEFSAQNIALYSCPFLWPEPTIRFTSLTRPMRQALAITFPWRFSLLLKKLKAHLVHSHFSSHIDWQLQSAIKTVGIPLVWTIHGLYLSRKSEGVAPWKNAMAIIRSSHRGHVVGVSDAVVQEFVNYGVGSPSEIAKIANGIDLDNYQNAQRHNPPLRDHWGIPRNAILFGSTGRLTIEKAYEVWVQAARQLVNQHPERQNLYFVIAGEGGQRQRLEHEIVKHDLAGRFILLGNQTNIPTLLREFDVFVLPSRSESFGISLVEAMAAGLPCIASTVGGLPEILDSSCGMLVPPESPDALCQAMGQMLDRGRRQILAAAAPTVAQKFSIEACAEKYAALYHRCLASANHAPPR